MTNRLSGKKCFVSAAAQGIGRETAFAFAREGADVVATDIAMDKLRELAGVNSSIEVRHLDVTDSAEVASFFEHESGFDVVFNCAGLVHHGSILDCDLDDWSKSFRLNVESMFRVCKAVIPWMLERGAGSIINMSSVASSIIGVPNRCAYGASKGAVIGLTKSIAADYVAMGIRCNAICPGTVMTPSLEDRVRSLGPDQDKNWQAFVSRQPIGRIGEASEIAALAVYLASDESSFTTGTVNVIDGGWSTL